MMQWQVERDSEHGFLVVRTSGRFDTASHRRMIEDIVTQTFWRPGTDVLFDHRAIDFGDSGIEQMRAAESNHAAFDERIGDGRAAILMDGAASFGLGRQFTLLAEDEVAAHMRVFTDEEAAVQWLMRSSTR